MKRLNITDLLTLEEYDAQRPIIKDKLLGHKKNRTVNIGNHITLIFEDYETIKYQVQEMLRIEKIFNKDEIQSEIDAYSPLIPDGHNLKATMLIMYPNVSERKAMLKKLYNIENKIWIRVNDGKKYFAISDEDLERSTDDKTSAVHFLRFELDEDVTKEFKLSNQIYFGSDHDSYIETINITTSVRDSLQKDFD